MTWGGPQWLGCPPMWALLRSRPQARLLRPGERCWQSYAYGRTALQHLLWRSRPPLIGSVIHEQLRRQECL
jgi:hypothetical protein